VLDLVDPARAGSREGSHEGMKLEADERHGDGRWYWEVLKDRRDVRCAASPIVNRTHVKTQSQRLAKRTCSRPSAGACARHPRGLRTSAAAVNFFRPRRRAGVGTLYSAPALA
jgi:hypothetical protein